MNKSLKIALAAGFLSSVGLVGVSVSQAVAQPTSFSFRIGDVRVAYNDGYYDRNYRWRPWRSVRERNWYRTNYRANYRWMRRDADRDGVPNRFDRDRDNDGVRNAWDRRPNNPYRR